MITEYKMAEMIVSDYGRENGCVFAHEPESVDLLVTLQRLKELEDNDELPDDVGASYRVVMHNFFKLFEPA